MRLWRGRRERQHADCRSLQQNNIADVWRCLCRYLAGLFALAHDPSGEVRKPVCTGLVQLLHLQPERLAAHMRDIIEYMLESTQVPTRPPLWFPVADHSNTPQLGMKRK